MNFTKTIQIDMTNRQAESITATAVSGENGSRSLCFVLLENGAPWTIPNDCTPVLAFRTEDGFRGEYDTMPDGSEAVSWQGNRVTVELIDQILARAGVVELSLVLMNRDLNRAEAFRVFLMVEQGIGQTEEVPEDYYQVRSLEELNAALEVLEEFRGDLGALDRTKGDGLCLEGSGLYLTSGNRKLGAGVSLPEPGLVFDGGYTDAAGQLHLTAGGRAAEGFAPVALASLDGLSWDLGEYAVYESSEIALRFVATEDRQAVIKLSVDGSVREMAVVGRAGETAVCQISGLSHGVHNVMAWLEYGVEGVTMETGKLRHIALVVTEQYPVVAVLNVECVLWEGEKVDLRYLVVDPMHETASIQLIQGGQTDADTVSVNRVVDRSLQVWTYQADAPGEITLSVDCDNPYGNASADVDLRIQPRNIVGRDGKSAYQSYLDGGGTLSEAEWAARMDPDRLADAAAVGAPMYPVTESGTEITLEDQSCPPKIAALMVYGRSWLEGTPDGTASYPVHSVGDGGSVSITVSDGVEQAQSAAFAAGLPLRGIPVKSGENMVLGGQSWVADIAQITPDGVSVRRNVMSYTFKGSEGFAFDGMPVYTQGTSTNGFVVRNNLAKGETQIGLCNSLEYVNNVYANANAVGYTLNNNQIHLRLANAVIGVADDAGATEKAAAFKAYLKARYDSGDPVVVYYATSAPATEVLPAVEGESLLDLPTHAPTTVIGNDAGAHMEAEAKVSMVTAVRRLEKLVNGRLSDAEAALAELGVAL